MLDLTWDQIVLAAGCDGLKLAAVQAAMRISPVISLAQAGGITFAQLASRLKPSTLARVQALMGGPYVDPTVPDLRECDRMTAAAEAGQSAALQLAFLIEDALGVVIDAGLTMQQVIAQLPSAQQVTAGAFLAGS